VRPWIKYSLIRLSIFIVVLVVLLIIGMNPFLAAVVAAVAGFVIAYVFFRRVRDEVAAELAARGTKAIPVKNVDTEAEDSALDATGPSE
jgi:ABC-type bacteriocin/lantibiotic exporter with double-glycine peptidase domain